MGFLHNPEGKETLDNEVRAMQILGKKYIETPKDEPSIIDGFIYENDILNCIYEVKTRKIGYDQLKSFGDMLISHNKVFNGAALARSLCVPLIGLIYLIPDDLLLVVVLADKHGNMLFDRAGYEDCQTTMYGGRTEKYCAYYNWEKMKVWNPKN